MKNFYHFCNEGLKSDIIFRNQGDFIAGMNRVALCYLHCIKTKRDVSVICFCLMDNHVHYILHGVREDCEAFCYEYRFLTSIWIGHHRDEKLNSGMEFEGWPIHSREKLKEKVAYVLRNPVAAGIKTVASGYRWGSGKLMFCDNSDILPLLRGMSDMSEREKNRILGTRFDIPGDWKILPDGMIWPGCYVQNVLAEDLFQSIGEYQFLLNDSRIDKQANEEMMSGRVSLPDGDILARANTFASELLGRRSIGQCTVPERITIARILRKEFGCNHKQLSRITRLDIDDVRKLV